MIEYKIFVIDPYRFTFCRFDSILLGAALAIYLKYNTFNINARTNSNYILFITLIIFFFISIYISNENKYFLKGGFLLINAFCLYVVFFAIKFPNQKILSNEVLRWLGRRSYGIYVYHFPIFSALERFREAHSLTNLIFIIALRFILTIIFAELSFRFIEQPILKLKKAYQTATLTQENLQSLSN